jgi:tetratricopeptide (TPR) repeat protein
LREEGHDAYAKQDFRNAVLKYTMALQVHISEPCTTNQADDVRALILANRSAALFMLDTYELAATDCRNALQFVSDQNVGFASDCGLVLKAKLFASLGKSLLKVGKLLEAEQSFCDTISTANSALAPVLVVSDESQQKERFLTQLITDAESGKITVKRCHVADSFFVKFESGLRPTESVQREALLVVVEVLQFAPGSACVHKKKLTLLASLKRWRELAGHCERLAASTTKLNGIFEGDLADVHPFPQAMQTKSLEFTFFGYDAVESSTKKLGVEAVGEAVVRLPKELLPLYLRALRLEERYPQAISAIHALENLVKLTQGSSNHQCVRVQFAWLSNERDKVSRTQTAKDQGDALFRNMKYKEAAAQYTSCLTIDSEQLPDAELGEVSNAGGKLHAILYCNRAACYMALKKYHEAVTDCTSALRIHSHYMKAMLRRSRCYHHLQRYEEATVEFNRWLELVKKAKQAPQDSELLATPCLFDSPKEISDAELEKVKKELLEVVKAKRMAENTTRSEASFRNSRRHWFEDSFGQNDYCGVNAQQRKEQWYNQQGTSSCRWDSFAGRSTRRDAKPDQKPEQRRQQQQHGSQYDTFHGRNNRQDRQQPQRSPVSDMSADHYLVLDVARNASESQIKKAYRKVRGQSFCIGPNCDFHSHSVFFPCCFRWP